jgi:hypothetical protein
MVNLEFVEELPALEPVGDESPVRIPLDDELHEGNWLSRVRAEVADIVGPHVTEAVVDDVKLIVSELGSNADRGGRTARAMILGRIVASNELLVGITDDEPTWEDDSRDRALTLTPSKSNEPSKDLVRQQDSRDSLLKGQGTQGRGLGLVQELATGPVHYSPERNPQGRLDGKTVWVAVDPEAAASAAVNIPFNIDDIKAL